MNTNLVKDMAKKTLNGEISFGQVVSHLTEAGFESYRTDFVRKETIYYMPNGENIGVPLEFEDHELAESFSSDGIQSAIKASQKGEIKYRQFIERALDSGITSYMVFFNGKKVIYFGRNGETHTELFPQVKA